MKNQRETALETFKAQSIKQDPISWHLWKRAFDEGVRYQEQLVKNDGVLDDVSNTEGKLEAVEDLKEFARNNCREWNFEELEEIISRL